MDIVTSLLEAHGQGGATCIDRKFSQWTYDNAYLMADKQEAWVLETAGKYWAAKQITSMCEMDFYMHMTSSVCLFFILFYLGGGGGSDKQNESIVKSFLICFDLLSTSTMDAARQPEVHSSRACDLALCRLSTLP